MDEIQRGKYEEAIQRLESGLSVASPSVRSMHLFLLAVANLSAGHPNRAQEYATLLEQVNSGDSAKLATKYAQFRARREARDAEESDVFGIGRAFALPRRDFMSGGVGGGVGGIGAAQRRFGVEAESGRDRILERLLAQLLEVLEIPRRPRDDLLAFGFGEFEAEKLLRFGERGLGLLMRRKQDLQAPTQVRVTGAGLFQKSVTGDAGWQFKGSAKQRFLAFLW